MRFTLTRDNADQLPELLALADDEGIDKFYLSHLVYAGRGDKHRGEDAEWSHSRQAMDFLIERGWDAVQWRPLLKELRRITLQLATRRGVEHLSRSPTVYKPVVVSDWSRPGRHLLSVTQGMIEWPRPGFAEIRSWIHRNWRTAMRARVCFPRSRTTLGGSMSWSTTRAG